ncbi:MAG: hypothetical protein D4R64_15360 [Porphyromonadaceae bacterium]|nr:MAG: hypothetical protein D4R64_15360 [Porphyromonadaceae bacterium]
MLDQSQFHLIEILLSLAGALILILLGIIGFWIQKWIRATDALTEAITNLKVLFATSQSAVTNLEKRCDNTCKTINERLNSHSDSIHFHETEIAILKTNSQ